MGTGPNHAALLFVLISLPLKLAIFWRVGIYRRLWRYAGIIDVERLISASTASGLAGLLIGALLLPVLGLTAVRVPLSVLFMDGLLTAAFAAAPRFAVRAFGRRGQQRRLLDARARSSSAPGAAGEMIVKELLGHPALGLNPIGFVDDDRSKHGHRLCDLPVLGPCRRIPELVLRHEIDELVIAMPRAPGAVVRQVVRAALEAGVKTRTVPAMFDIISGRVAVASLRQVEIQDLLRREPIQTDLEQVRVLATGETVLVTGAGGSIGSELCRQLARLEPAQILAARPRRELDLRHPGRADRALPQRDRGPRHRRRPRPRAAAAGLRAVPALLGLPRRRAQARAADGGEHRRGGDQQRARHQERGGAVGGVRGRAPRADLDRQGRAAHQRHGRHQAGGRADRAGDRRGPRAEVRRRAVRQRARQPGQRGADLPAADPDRRPGDGDPPGDAPLLHDHPGGGAAGAAGGRDRARAARSSCSTWASRSRCSTWRPT